ncbi:hypothetical protein [Salinispora pacifica]|uniref:hypothetical protein n=1 Tax=Salinispora pacifica TaxID=351187 RepID=UPI000488D4A7
MAARYKEMVCKGAAWSIFHPTLLLPTLRRRTAATRNGAARPTACAGELVVDAGSGPVSGTSTA